MEGNACSKCDWRAAFLRDDLIASHGADQPMPNLLNHLAAPSCNRLGSHWDRCGVHYVEPVEEVPDEHDRLPEGPLERYASIRQEALWCHPRRTDAASV